MTKLPCILSALALAIATPAANAYCDDYICVTTENILSHLKHWDSIRQAYNTSRTWDSIVYDEAAYDIVAKLEAVGYNVTMQPFEKSKYEVAIRP